MFGRVHWLLWNLSPNFKGVYRLRFDYNYHRYVFYRTYGIDQRSKRLKDCFIIVRTSKKCFRMMYFNDVFQLYLYESFKTSIKCALRMEELFKKYR